MVNCQEVALDRTFAALSDPTRRAILAQLGKRSHSISELAKPQSMTLPAIMKHLTVLSDAGLVTRVKTGRTVACTLNAAPMEEATTWLARYKRLWEDRFDRLGEYLQELQEGQNDEHR
jgi:DNA-binding transcriptional ArsR family regulator